MPGTFSHPAAVLPLRRLTPWPLSFVALVIGSTTPDVGYFINRFDLSSFAHSLPGIFLACLPTGIVMLIGVYCFARPVCYALPSPHRDALTPICPIFPRKLSAWLMIVISLLLGAWSHTFWDAFTHDNGWFVERIAFLRASAFRTGSNTTHVYLALQEGSTIIGFLIVVGAYWLWLHRQGKPLLAFSVSDLWRYLFWIAIAVISFTIAIPAAYHFANSTSLRDFFYGRSVAFHIALYATDVGLPLALIGTTIIYAMRPRPGPAMTAKAVTESIRS
jgi:hypothetical protein